MLKLDRFDAVIYHSSSLNTFICTKHHLEKSLPPQVCHLCSKDNYPGCATQAYPQMPTNGTPSDAHGQTPPPPPPLLANRPPQWNMSLFRLLLFWLLPDQVREYSPRQLHKTGYLVCIIAAECFRNSRQSLYLMQSRRCMGEGYGRITPFFVHFFGCLSMPCAFTKAYVQTG